MPATITHAYFVKDVIDILPDDIKNNLNLCRSMMFGQSTDSLMFYNLFSLLPGKKIRDFQGFFHNNNTQDFFINLLRYIKDNNIHDIDTYSFLVGFICHYALDSTIHPFIIYKTGIFDKNNRFTYKYNNVHAFMEAFIDNDMVYRREKTNPYKFNIGSFCFDTKPFSKDLNNTIDFSFYNTYKLNDMNKIYYKSIKQMKYSLELFRRDPYGIKKFMYKLLDTFTTKRTYRFEAISYHYNLEDRHDYLNLDHRMWRNPTTYNMTSTESFPDLYFKAIKKAKVMVCASFDYLDNKGIELEKVFDNTSYVTGLNCNDKKTLKYFEF